jgi:hypothetical protein
MKIFGWVLIVVGIAMLLLRGIHYKTQEKVVDIGPVEINKTENHNIGWPVYAGGIITLAGIFMVVTASKKSA